MNNSLYVSKILYSTSSDGPGLRNSLYLSGCHLRCEGCHNSAYWDIKNGVKKTVEEIYRLLNIDDFNISILGGEPLMQYYPLLELCRLIKEKTKKTIWMWTGYEIPYLEIFYGDILRYVDVVVDGPFQKDLYVPNLKWRGSTNQRFWEIQHNNQNNTIALSEISI